MSSKSQSPERNNYLRQQKRQGRDRREGRQLRQGRQGREDPDSHKIFLTNLNGDMSEQEVQAQVKKLFQKYGQVTKLSLKKHKNGYYYFGFLQYPKGFQAYQAVKALDQYSLFGKNMKVRQDRQSQGCFYCKRMGHFARQCPQNRGRRRQRSYSNERRSRDRYQRRRDDRYQKYDRRQRDRDYRQRDRYERGDRYENDRDHQRQRDRHRHEKRRHRQRSYSDSRSSSSSYRRQDRKDKQKKQRRKRSRS